MVTGVPPELASGATCTKPTRRAKLHAAKACADGLILNLKDKVLKLEGTIEILLAKLAVDGVGIDTDWLLCIAPT